MTEIRTIRVLYMEDDPGLSRLLQKSLQRRGYVVDVASNGREGVEMLKSSCYDIILVDYNMPFMGGIDVIRALASRGEFSPAIMITGNGNEEIAVEALKLGASDYVVKDGEMRYIELLPAVIDKAIYNRQLVKEKQQMYAALQESEERYRRLVELSPDGIAIHVDGKFAFINPAGARLLGASDTRAMIGKESLEVVHPDFREAVKDRFKLLQNDSSARAPWLEEKYVRLDGRELDVEVTGAPFIYNGRQAIQVIFRSIRERKLAKQRLEYLALYDPLTDLPNRMLLFDRLNQAVAIAKRNAYTVALLFLDLDRFKEVNDAYGHDVGDMLLRAVADRLTSCLRKTDTVARMGGDEFTIILSKIEKPQDTEIVAEKIMNCLKAPFSLKGFECSIGASIGISLFPEDSDDGDMLLKYADSAMYLVKQSGRNGYRFYSQGAARRS